MKRRTVLALALAAAPLSACGINSVPTAEEEAKAKWADVQAAYQRRANLIPNLVATVKGAAASEGKILSDVTNARARAASVQVSGDQLTDPAAMLHVADLVHGARGGRGELRVRAPLPEGGEARVLLGRDFLLDAELAASLEALHGVEDVAFKTSETRLALVG